MKLVSGTRDGKVSCWAGKKLTNVVQCDGQVWTLSAKSEFSSNLKSSIEDPAVRAIAQASIVAGGSSLYAFGPDMNLPPNRIAV